MKKIDLTTDNNMYEMYLDSRAVFTKEIRNSNTRKEYLQNYSIIKDPDAFYDISCKTAENIKGYLYKYGYMELILEVTEACNFRCQYCIFGGSYETMRSHASRNMRFETAKAAIDYYFNSIKVGQDYNPLRRPSVAFYGGEPLLNFSLIKQCVEYIKEVYPDYNTYFTITTNGSLMTEEISRFFYANNINPIVSLDGPEQEHDRNRKFVNGEKSFKQVMKNIHILHQYTKEPVMTEAVYDVRTDLLSLSEFFDTTPEVFCINTSPVRSYNTKYYEQFTQKEIDKFNKTEEKLLQLFLEDVRNGTSRHPFASRFFIGKCMMFLNYRIDWGNKKYGIIKYTGACVPGSKIFVSVEGRFFLCEKVSHNRCYGNVQEGLYFEEIAQYVNELNQCSNECIECKARNICTLCPSLYEDGLKKLFDNKICDNNRREIGNALKLAYDIFELNPTWVKAYVTDYYEKLKEMMVRLI